MDSGADHPAAVEVEGGQGVAGLAALVGGRTRVEQQLGSAGLVGLARLVPRDVAVAEDDDVGVGEPAAQPTGPAGGLAAVVDHGDSHPVDVHDERLGEDPHQVPVVVAQHGVDRGEAAQLVEDLAGHDVAGVQDQVGPPEVVEGGRRQAARRPGPHVGVGEHHGVDHGPILPRRAPNR